MPDTELTEAFLELQEMLAEQAPARHPQQTDQCPSLVRFALRQGDWSDEERAHMTGCPYCTKMLAIASEIETESSVFSRVAVAARIRWNESRRAAEAIAETVRHLVVPNTTFPSGFLPADPAQAVGTLGSQGDRALGCAFSEEGDAFWVVADGDTGRVKATYDGDVPPRLGLLAADGSVRAVYEWTRTQDGWEANLGDAEELDGILVASATGSEP